MIFSLDVRRARKGDCLLLHSGSKGEPGLVLIDGGPSDVYKPHLKPRLLEIRKARKLDASVPLPVDVLMVSHVDDDHIRGILDLTSELLAAPAAPLVRLARCWHNSFDDVIGKNPAVLSSVTAQFGAAGFESGEWLKALAREGDEVARDTFSVLASIAQGHALRGNINALNVPLNPGVKNNLLLANKKALAVASGLTFTVVGPMKPELLALQKDHDDWLKEQLKQKRSNEAALAAYVDQSVPNLSSIVVLAKAEKKTILLTGDARGDKIIEGLESIGAMKAGGKIHVDVLKVPHHGSSNNLDTDFFERITADHYVFSGNGEHGNPERDAMKMLFDARGKDPFEIHLTYPVADIDVLRRADWEKEQAKEKARKTKKVRPNWSAKTNSLASFFAAVKPTAQQPIRVVDAAKPHVIDLATKLGF